MKARAALLALTLASPAAAQTTLFSQPQPTQVAQAEAPRGPDAAERYEDAARERETQAEAARAQAARIAAELAESRKRVAEVESNIQRYEGDIRSARERLAALSGEYASASAKLRTRREEYAAAIGAMVALSKTPAPAMLAHAGRPVDAARSRASLDSLADALVTDAAALRRELAEIEAMRQRGVEIQKEAEAAILAMRREEQDLQDALSSRAEDQQEAVDRAQALLQEAAALAEKADAVRILLRAAPPPMPRPPRAVARTPTTTRAAPTARPAADPFRPYRPLEQAYGRMTPPVIGDVTIGFGQTRPGATTPSIGQFYAARPLARVYAPWYGRVSFAGEMRNYGTVVMLDIGEGAQLMLVGLAETDRKANDVVLPGEPVGRLGGPITPGAEFLVESSSVNHRATASLYFEFRRSGQPVDPAPWLESGAR